MPKYKVEWKELVTYSVEVDAFNPHEAQDLAQCDYGHDDEVKCEYYDGSMQVERLDQWN
jgi:hypothetical protein